MKFFRVFKVLWGLPSEFKAQIVQCTPEELQECASAHWLKKGLHDVDPPAVTTSEEELRLLAQECDEDEAEDIIRRHSEIVARNRLRVAQQRHSGSAVGRAGALPSGSANGAGSAAGDAGSAGSAGGAGALPSGSADADVALAHFFLISGLGTGRYHWLNPQCGTLEHLLPMVGTVSMLSSRKVT